MLWNEAKGAEKQGKVKIFGGRWLLCARLSVPLSDFSPLTVLKVRAQRVHDIDVFIYFNKQNERNYKEGFVA